MRLSNPAKIVALLSIDKAELGQVRLKVEMAVEFRTHRI